jgi:integrase
MVLAYTGLRWGELAGLQVGDRIVVPGAGLRLQRAVLEGSGGQQFVDTLKSHRARSVPLTDEVAEIVGRWADGKRPCDWVFSSKAGTALREGNWKRSVKWSEARLAIGRPTLRVHDLRHTAASIWLSDGADPKVVQRILGHASATMTMDLYGHLIDGNLWTAATQISARRAESRAGAQRGHASETTHGGIHAEND